MAFAHGAFLLASGLWPLISRRTFEAATGPKVDWWLVQTVGGLLAVSGATLLTAAARDEVTDEHAATAAGTAGVLGAIAAVHASRGRISKVYMLDAMMELGIIGGWLLARRAARSEPERTMVERDAAASIAANI